MNRLKPYFSSDIKEYMELNGFKKIGTDCFPNHMQFLKGNLAVIFHDNKITKSDEAQLHPVTYIGFDGKDITGLMMLLHVMGAVPLQQVRDAARSEAELGIMREHFINHINPLA